MDRKFKEKGLAVISVSFDPPGEPAVLQKLKELEATFDNVIARFDVRDYSPSGGIPYYQLYDRSGKLRYQFSPFPGENEEPTDNMEKRIEELLAENEAGSVLSP